LNQAQTITNSELANSILENIGALVLVSDGSGSVIYCSPSILKLLAVTNSEVLGTGWWDLTRLDTNSRQKEIDTIKKTIQGEIPLNRAPYVKKINDKHGNEYWIQWQDSTGPGNTLIGVGQNITDQYHAQKLIEEQRLQLKRLSLVAEKTNNIILILDNTGNVEWVSESFERLNKISLAELVAAKGPNILTISNNPRISELLQRVITEKISLSYESKNTKISEEVWEFSTMSPVLNDQGELTNIIIIDSDITSKKKMEAELEKLSIIASKTDNAVLIADTDCTIEWINEGLLNMYSKNISSIKQIYGKSFIELSSNPNIKNLVDQCRTSKHSVSYEAESTNAEGKAFWVQSTMTPILDENREISKFIIIDTDISARKESEEMIREKNKDITDSINYAQRIQHALLPDEQKICDLLPESFVLFLPRDIVSGDFYFIENIKMNSGISLTGFSVGDCTGHGVPGAFLSMMGTSFLKQSLVEKTVNSPAEALEFVSNRLNNILFHQNNSAIIKDGIDIGFCVLNPATLEMYFAGAGRPLVIVGNEGLREIDGNKRAVGFSENMNAFTNHSVKLNKGDYVYLFSDGYNDQFGGPKGKKFKYKQLKALLLSLKGKPMSEQKETLLNTFMDWKGNLAQVDDVCIMGVRV